MMKIRMRMQTIPDHRWGCRPPRQVETSTFTSEDPYESTGRRRSRCHDNVELPHCSPRLLDW